MHHRNMEIKKQTIAGIKAAVRLYQTDMIEAESTIYVNKIVRKQECQQNVL